MFNKIALFLTAVCLASLIGCATPMVAQPAAAPPMPVPAQPGPMPMMGPAVYGPGGAIIPPAQPPVAGPPQNWAWLNTPPFGCEKGPLAMQISNQTEDKFVQLSLDGEPLMIRGAYGLLPQLPPGATVYLCLSRQGIHTLRGVAFINRMGVLEPAATNNKFSSEINVTAPTGYRFFVNTNLFFFGSGSGLPS